MQIKVVNQRDKVDLTNSALIITLNGCGPCNELKSRFSDINTQLNKYNNKTAKIYNIDSNIFANLARKKGLTQVTSFPTILIIKNNKVVKTYDGDRSVNHLKNFFQTELGLTQKGGAKSKRKRNSKRNNTRSGKCISKRMSKRINKCRCKGTRKCMCNKKCKCKSKI